MYVHIHIYIYTNIQHTIHCRCIHLYLQPVSSGISDISHVPALVHRWDPAGPNLRHPQAHTAITRQTNRRARVTPSKRINISYFLLFLSIFMMYVLMLHIICHLLHAPPVHAYRNSMEAHGSFSLSIFVRFHISKMLTTVVGESIGHHNKWISTLHIRQFKSNRAGRHKQRRAGRPGRGYVGAERNVGQLPEFIKQHLYNLAVYHPIFVSREGGAALCRWFQAELICHVIMCS